ncbi:MAG: SRPBCC domain-containing protein [Rhizobiales bacterium]|nr:SRPBCC domain-containing protein [Hyphomicrobiales bacterium]
MTNKLNEISKSIILNASRETVWVFLTQKDKLGQWFHPAENDLELGKAYKLLRADGEKICWGEVTEMQAPSRLAYTFSIKPLNGAMTNVVWVLEEIAGGTKLTLTHDGIEKAARDAALGLLTALDSGWDEHLKKLRNAD